MGLARDGPVFSSKHYFGTFWNILTASSRQSNAYRPTSTQCTDSVNEWRLCAINSASTPSLTVTLNLTANIEAGRAHLTNCSLRLPLWRQAGMMSSTANQFEWSLYFSLPSMARLWKITMMSPHYCVLLQQLSIATVTGQRRNSVAVVTCHTSC